MSYLAGFYVVRGGEPISGPHSTREEANDVLARTGADSVEEVNTDEQTQSGQVATDDAPTGDQTADAPSSKARQSGVPASDVPADASDTSADQPSEVDTEPAGGDQAPA